MKNWHISGKRVQHVLSGWIGTVTGNHFSEVTIAHVRFWNEEKDEFVELECVKSELREPEESNK